MVLVLIRTGVAHRRVQQVHGGSAQAQSVHPVRGLFEIRHHARSAGGGRPESGRAESCRFSRRSGSAPAREKTAREVGLKETKQASLKKHANYGIKLVYKYVHFYLKAEQLHKTSACTNTGE